MKLKKLPKYIELDYRNYEIVECENIISLVKPRSIYAFDKYISIHYVLNYSLARHIIFLIKLFIDIFFL